ncbi:MAG: FAD-dependent oxidoreductase [Bacteroidota bacterium]
MKVHIIGGGIIGLCSAYYLQKEGAEVTIIDKNEWRDGCSFGNAGMITPSHFIPLAAPGVVAKGIRWMFSDSSPFYIRPRLDMDLLQWLWKFYRSCNKRQVARAIPILRDINWWSRSLYKDLAEQPDLQFGYEQNGLMMLCHSKEALREEIEHAEKAQELGLEVQILHGADVRRVEQNIKTSAAGAVYYPGDAHLHPNQLMQQLQTHLRKQGVQFISSTTIIGMEQQQGRIRKLHTRKGKEIAVEQVVLAAGSWSAHLMKSLQLRLLLQDGKGYSMTLQKPQQRPSVPTILAEAKVAITPMGTDLRVGGTLEISNLDPSVNMSRLRGILSSLTKYYKDFELQTPNRQAVWHGFRPCTPDGMPYIGRTRSIDNLILATGHAMIGLSLGPATGKLVSELLTGQAPSMDMALFAVDRF